MNKRPQILVIVNQKLEHSPAVLRALSLARRMDATLQLRSFEFVRTVANAAKRGFDLDAYLRGRHEHLEELADHLRREGVSVECQVVWGHPIIEKIIFETLALQPDLVIKDVPRHDDLARAALDSLDWRLLNECPAPLMLVQPHSASLPLHMMAAVDPQDEHGKPHELNDDILDIALRLATQCKAALDVVNVFDYMPPVGEEQYAGWIPDLTLFGELRKIHAEGLYDLGKLHGIPPSEMHILDGNPAECITHFAAARGVDLVIMGSIHRTGLKRLFLGSTAEGVFDGLPCDVLLIKPEGFSAELQRALEEGHAEAA